MSDALLTSTARILSALLSRRDVRIDDMERLATRVREVLRRVVAPETPAGERAPAVPIAEALGDEWLVCLECGRHLKTLRRHLRSTHGLTPETYRRRWNLARQFPMTAPAYARVRREIAARGSFTGVPRSLQ